MAGKPTALNQLTGGYKVYYSSYTESAALNLGFIPIGSATGTKSSAVQVYSFLQFVEMPCQINNATVTVSWGAGAEAILHIKKAKAGLNLNKLSTVAAGVELGRANVKFSMQTFGVTGDAIRTALPAAGDFNVENYARLINAVDEVRKRMGDAGVVVVPKLLIEKSELMRVSSR